MVADERVPDWYDEGEKGSLLPSDSARLNDLELWADSILATDRRNSGETAHSKLREILSTGQLRTRRSREVYTKYGVPDVSLVSGQFGRVYPDRSGIKLPPEDLSPDQVSDVVIRRVDGKQLNPGPEDAGASPSSGE